MVYDVVRLDSDHSSWDETVGYRISVPNLVWTMAAQILPRAYVVNSRRSSEELKDVYIGQSEGWTTSYHNQLVRHSYLSNGYPKAAIRLG